MREEFQQVLDLYLTARADDLTNHSVAALISRELADQIREPVDSDSYRLTGSPGRGNWAETPWVSVFDRLVTETAQRGFYIVYRRGHIQTLCRTGLALVQARDALVEDADPAAVEASVEAGMEAMKERLHRRSERNPKLAQAAKEYHGITCMVCGFNFEETYGEIGVGYIEAHHLTPFADLNGRPTKLDPKAHFAVVCPNCHRMLHQKMPPPTSDGPQAPDSS